MNDELRAAFDRLDAALAEARAAMEPEPRCPNCGSTRKFRQDDKGRWLCDHCGYLAPAPQPEAVLDYSGPLPSNMCPNCEDIMQWDLLSDGSWRCPACEYVLRAVDADIQPEPATEPEPEVRMVLTYCDGTTCEVAPDNISGVGIARHATTIETNAPLADGSCVHHVREPVAVVQRMIDACKGDDSSEHTE